MFDRFTLLAGRVMGLTSQEAQRLNHEYIGTEHILLGLVQERSGITATLLKNYGVDLEKVRAEVEKMIPHGPPIVTTGQPAFTPRAYRVLGFAQQEADDSGQYDIGTEHLLLGLLHEKEGVGAHILRQFGLTFEVVRQEVLEAWKVEQSRRDAAQMGTEWPPVPDRYTDRARIVRHLAGQEAPFQQGIGTEHILLGLVEERGGLAAIILKNFNLSAAKVRAGIEKVISHGPSKGSMGQQPFTPRAKRALDFAQDEARILHHDYIGTEHLLLGLLREVEGTAAQVLVHCGLVLEDVREEVLKVLKADQRGGAGSKFGPSAN